MSEKMTCTLREYPSIFTITSRSILLIIKGVSDKSCRESQYTHFIFVTSSRKSCRCEIMTEKYGRAGQTTDDNMAHALCMLDN